MKNCARNLDGNPGSKGEEMMKVTYLGHSGFLVETAQNLLLFDWYLGDLPLLPPEKPLFVFVSHAHRDHYSGRIWEFASRHPGTTYLLSYDLAYSLETSDGKKPEEAKFMLLFPHKSYEIEGLGRVDTLLSTDQGVAFLVRELIDGGETARLYHAGDLNWWDWAEDDADERKRMEEQYKEEIGRLQELTAGRAIDAAFVPLDDRLKENEWKGMDLALRMCPIRYAFPMHWTYPDVIGRYLSRDTGDLRPDTVIVDTSTLFDIEIP